MSNLYPGGTNSFTNPAGTSEVTSPDHAGQHSDANDAMEAHEAVLGTNSGTSVLKHFTAGQFPIRATGVAARGTLVQTIVGGTLDDNTIGTPVIADFTNAAHNHGDADDGGAVVAAAIPTASISPDKLATGAVTGTVATSQTGTIQAYGDLATAGPIGTVTIGANGLALVVLYASMSNSNASNSVFMGFAVTGASTVAVADSQAVQYQAFANAAVGRYSASFLLAGLTPGLGTFTAKYKVTGGTGTWADRAISVIPL